MRIITRVVLVYFLTASVQALRSQPATAEATNVARAGSGPAMDADAERRARELLEKLSSAPTTNSTSAASIVVPRANATDPDAQARDVLHKLNPPVQPPGVATVPSDSQAREAARQKSLEEARQLSTAQQPPNVAVGANSALEAEREREIKRIEAEVEAARQRREAAANSQTVAPPPAAQAPVVEPSVAQSPVTQPPAAQPPVVQPPVARPSVTPVTDATGLGTLQKQTANPPPAAVVAQAPSAPASPAAPTLTPESEAKARELLRRNMMIIFSDNPPAQVTTPGRAPLPSSQASSPSPNAVLPPPAAVPPPVVAPPVRAEVPTAPAAVASPAATPSASAPALSGTDEERARDLLRKLTEGTATAQPASARDSRVLPPPAATLDLPPGAGNTPVTPAPAAPIEQPKAQAVPPPSTAAEPPASPTPVVPPPLEIPRPAVAPVEPAPVAPPAAAPNPQEEAARAVVREAVANLRGTPPVSVPTTPAAVVPPVATPPPVITPPVETAVAPPVAAPAISAQAPLTPDAEAKARELLHLKQAEIARAPVLPLPAPTVVTTAPAYTAPAPGATTPAPVTTSPAAVATVPSSAVPPPAGLPTPAPSAQAVPAAALTPETELKAREVVAQQVAELRRSALPVTPATTVPSPSATLPAPSATVPAPPATAPAASTFTPETEARIREALDKTQVPPPGAVASIPAPGNVGSAEELKAKRELIKQQEREGKKRRAEEKRIEAMAKKQAEQLERQSTVKAREDARRQLDAEAKARQSGQTISGKSTSTSPAAPAGSFKPGTGTKRQRLDQLTDAYVHDRIGAEEYHRQRAKIVAEPGE